MDEYKITIDGFNELANRNKIEGKKKGTQGMLVKTNESESLTVRCG